MPRLTDEVQFIRDHIKTTFYGDSPIGQSLIRTLKGIEVKEAEAMQIEDMYSIWEIVAHISSWIEATLKTLKTGKMFDPVEIENWSDEKLTEEKWNNVKIDLEKNVNLILNELAEWDNDRLHQSIQDVDYNYKNILHGAVHHALYHIGQITVLKEAVRSHAD